MTDPTFLASVDSALYGSGYEAGYVAAFQAMQMMAQMAALMEWQRQQLLFAMQPVAPRPTTLVHAPAADATTAERHMHYRTFGRSGMDSVRKGPTKAERDARAEAVAWGLVKAA